MDYEIIGANMQALKFNLKKGERIYSDSGKLVSKTNGIVMTPRLVGGVLGAFKREAVGASGMLTSFEAQSDGNVSVAGVFPGKVLVITLGPGQQFVAEENAFLAAEDTVNYSIQLVNLGAGFFGGEGFVLQKLVGPGKIFLHIVGDIVEHDLDGTGPVDIDPGHVAGFDASLQYKVRFVDNIRTAMFGGVGLFLATFTGKGRVYAHSVSPLKLATEIYIDGAKQQKKN